MLPLTTPAAEASDVFTDNWSTFLDLVKTMAPIVVGAALTLLAIRWVVGAVSKGRAPTMTGEMESYRIGSQGYNKRHGKSGGKRYRTRG